MILFLVLLAVMEGCCRPQGMLPVNVCVGNIQQVDGFRKLDFKDEELLRVASGQPGRGGLCIGEVFVVGKPLTVYRVWGRSKTNSDKGRWWSLEPPKGNLASWQALNDVCPEWNPADVVSKCELEKDTIVVLGTGQSATCNNGTFPPSPVNQLYIPNHLVVKGQDYVDKCQEISWPDR